MIGLELVTWFEYFTQWGHTIFGVQCEFLSKYLGYLNIKGQMISKLNYIPCSHFLKEMNESFPDSALVFWAIF